MNRTGFLKSGHWPSLLASFLYFDVSFMIWVLIGATGVFIAQDMQLSAGQKGLLVAIPILGGSVFRIFFGIMSDRIGAKRTALLGMVITLVPLLLMWLSAGSLPELYAYGFLLGIAGASFAAALPMASRWYPPKYQGLAMGIAGAGNSGTLLATLFAPRLAEYFGDWHPVFGLAMLPLLVVLIFYVAVAKEPPNQPARRKFGQYFAVLKQRDAWLFNFFYFVTFGGFVGMTSFLSIFFHDQYAVGKVQAGDFVSLCVLAGSLFRPLGGWLSDRLGGVSVLKRLFFAIVLLLVFASQMYPFWIELTCLFLLMICYGLGNGAVFQLVPQRFAGEIGTITGLVGAFGGIGGFFLPSLLGFTKQVSGTYSLGFLLLTAIVAAAFWAMIMVGERWKGQLILAGGNANTAV